MAEEQTNRLPPNDERTKGNTLQLDASFDRDVVDGAPATRFDQCLKDLVESGLVWGIQRHRFDVTKRVVGINEESDA